MLFKFNRSSITSHQRIRSASQSISLHRNRRPDKTKKLSNKMSKVTIAIEGCCHGELDNIYSTLMHLQQVEGKKIDLLICCGDFQAVRNMDDLETMACPAKYRSLQSFHKYYSGEAVAPIPTLFIGGNHEASNYLWELYHGGWAAPNIYFLGFAGCVKFGGIRIAGLSGIYKQGDYYKGHDERLPYTDGSMRSMYHIRDFEVNRLMQITEPVDIMLSHDWPRNIAKHGNTAALISRKPFLKEEIETETLGSAPGEQLLHTLQPSYWFSAHLHTKFAAVVQHPGGDLTTKFLALGESPAADAKIKLTRATNTNPSLSSQTSVFQDVTSCKLSSLTHNVRALLVSSTTASG